MISGWSRLGAATTTGEATTTGGATTSGSGGRQVCLTISGLTGSWATENGSYTLTETAYGSLQFWLPYVLDGGCLLSQIASGGDWSIAFGFSAIIILIAPDAHYETNDPTVPSYTVWVSDSANAGQSPTASVVWGSCEASTTGEGTTSDTATTTPGATTSGPATTTAPATTSGPATTSAAPTTGESFTINVTSTPPSGVAITGTDTGVGNYNGTTPYNTSGPIGMAITLTAPETHTGGYSFLKWTLNGTDQPLGELAVTFTQSADAEMDAVATYILNDCNGCDEAGTPIPDTLTLNSTGNPVNAVDVALKYTSVCTWNSDDTDGMFGVPMWSAIYDGSNVWKVYCNAAFVGATGTMTSAPCTPQGSYTLPGDPWSGSVVVS
jgi:hypothetical protein